MINVFFSSHPICILLDWTVYGGVLPSSYPIVGLDIQQKFNVYYSGARSFGSESPYHISHDRTGQRGQHSALKPQSTDHSATSAADQGTTLKHCHCFFFFDAEIFNFFSSLIKYDNFTIRFRQHKTVQPLLQEQGALWPRLL